MTGRRCRLITAAALSVCLAGSSTTAADYPLVLTLDAKATKGATAVTSRVTIKVDRLMDDFGRKRVTDALTHGGYPNFLPALRSMSSVGTIAVEARSVDIRYAHEQPDGAGQRLVLIADRPLFFIAGAPETKRAGYELTVVELRFDAQGEITGTMAGAARVKASAAGPVLDDFATVPVRLSGRVTGPARR
jgi:hypothetical protein